VTQVQTWIDAPAYDARGDIDLDGDVDATDKSTTNGSYSGITLGRGSLSASGVVNRKGYAGYETCSGLVGGKWLARNRVLAAELGRWAQRDPLQTSERTSLADYVGSGPLILLDPKGTESQRAGSGTGDGPGASGLPVPCTGTCNAVNYSCSARLESLQISTPIGPLGLLGAIAVVPLPLGFRSIAEIKICAYAPWLCYQKMDHLIPGIRSSPIVPWPFPRRDCPASAQRDRSCICSGEFVHAKHCVGDDVRPIVVLGVHAIATFSYDITVYTKDGECVSIFDPD